MSTGRANFAITLILIASILLLPGSLTAQTSTAPTGDWSRLTEVESASKLVVKLKTGKTVEGKLSNVSETTLTLSVKNKPVEIKRDDVRSVYQVKNKSATKATLIGLGVGAGVGAALGAAARNGNDGIFEEVEGEIQAGLTALGAGAGALTGFLLGRNRSKRVLIYETSQP